MFLLRVQMFPFIVVITVHVYLGLGTLSSHECGGALSRHCTRSRAGSSEKLLQMLATTVPRMSGVG